MEEYKELEQMREQLALLKDQLAKQSLENHLNMRNLAKDRLSSLKFRYWLSFGICIFALLYCPWAFYSFIGVSIWFNMVTLLFLLVALVFHIISHLDLWKNYFYLDMKEFSRRMVRIKRLNALWFKWGMIFVIPWFIWLIWELYLNQQFEYQWIVMGISCLIGGIIGFAIGYRLYSKEQHDIDVLVGQLDRLAEETE